MDMKKERERRRENRGGGRVESGRSRPAASGGLGARGAREQ